LKITDVGCKHCLFASYCYPSATKSAITQDSFPLKKHTLTLKPREKLCNYGSLYNNFYIVRTGILKAFVQEYLGKERILHFFFAGEILGYEFISTGKAPFNVSSVVETNICTISYANIIELAGDSTHLLKKILSYASYRINYSYYITKSSAEQRVIGFLLEITQRLHCNPDKDSVILPLSRQDIGNHLGLTAETVTRTLRRLYKMGLIQLKGKYVGGLSQLHSLI